MSLFDVSRPKIEKKAEKKMIGLERGTETDTESRRKWANTTNSVS